MARTRDEALWFEYLKYLRDGKAHTDALRSSGLSPAGFNSTLAQSAERQAEYEEAKTVNLRTQWTVKQLEVVMNDIISQKYDGKLKDILKQHKRDHADFLRLVERDPMVGAMFHEARRLQAQAMIDDLMGVVASNKVTERGEVQVITNKTSTLKWLMGVFNEEFKSAQKAQKEQASSAELEAKMDAARKRVEGVRQARDDTDPESEEDDEWLEENAFG